MWSQVSPCERNNSDARRGVEVWGFYVRSKADVERLVLPSETILRAHNTLMVRTVQEGCCNNFGRGRSFNTERSDREARNDGGRCFTLQGELRPFQENNTKCIADVGSAHACYSPGLSFISTDGIFVT